MANNTGDGKTGSGTQGDKLQLIDEPGTEQNSTRTAYPERSEIAPLQMEKKMHDEDRICGIGGLKVIIISVIAFSLSITVALIISIYYGPPQVAPHGAVSCDNKQCSDIGVQILKDGGNAIDAAIATSFCLAVVQPEATGLGGGGYLVLRRNKKLDGATYDFNGQAPSGVTDSTYTDYEQTKQGGLAVGIPGFVKGLADAHDDYGSKKWASLITPSADLATDGFEVSVSLAQALGGLQQDSTINTEFKSAILDQFMSNGALVQAGDTLTRPAFGSMLKAIAENGASAFYEDSYAEEMVKAINDAGGILTMGDFSAYKSRKQSPLVVSYHNLTVASSALPSSGLLTLATLNILNNFKFNETTSKSAAMYHIMIEASKMIYSQRGTIADPMFVDDMEALADQLLSPPVAFNLSSMISMDATHDAEWYSNVVGQVTQEGTSHVSVYGSNEDMVSVTTTLSKPFGSYLITSSGVILNSFMSDFAVSGMPMPNNMPINKNNLIQAGKRPVSPVAPILTYSAERPCARRAALGGEGGTSIAQGVMEVVLHMIGARQSLEPAISSPRFYAELYPNQVLYEDGLSPDIVSELEQIGHTMTKSSGALNVINGVAKINETIIAIADERGGGEASVF